MRSKFPFLFFVISIATFVKLSAQEHVYLWEITHQEMDKPSYLLGTLNIPMEELYHENEVPATIKRVIEQTDIVVLGLNQEHIRDFPKKILTSETNNIPSIVQRIEKIGEFEDYHFYLLHIPMGQLWIELESLFIFLYYKEKYKTKTTFWEKIRNEKMKELDEKIIQISKRKINSKLKLDELDNVVNVLKSAPADQMQLLVEKALDLAEQEKIEDMLKRRIEWYKNGQISAEKLNDLQGLGYDEEKERKVEEAYDLFTSAYIYRRNQKWVDNMNKWMLKENRDKSFLFVVEIVHLISKEQSLVQLLREKGYTVKECPQNMELALMRGNKTSISSKAKKVVHGLFSSADAQKTEDLTTPLLAGTDNNGNDEWAKK